LYAYSNPLYYTDLDGYKSIFGDATEQLGNFSDWLTQQNKAADSQLAAVAIGTAKFVTKLGEGITRPLDIAANLAQVATGVDDQQVRDELIGTSNAIGKATDFVVNGNYTQAAKNGYQAAVNETSKAMGGDVTATSNIVETVLAVATLKDGLKTKPTVTAETGSLLETETAALKRIQSNVAESKGLNERINQRGIESEIKQAAREVEQASEVDKRFAERPKFRKATETEAVARATDEVGEIRCVKCDKLLTGERQANGKRDFQLGHPENDPWVKQQDYWKAKAQKGEDFTRKDVSNKYQKNIEVECVGCNASDGAKIGHARNKQ
jgi:hypothetical protein